MSPKLLVPILVACVFPGAAVAQSGPASAAAKAGIDAGNQAWIDGVQKGNVAMIIATYADNAVDCGPSGECIRGRTGIEKHMREHLARLGRAQSAAVSSWGSTQQGEFVYEWGKAEAMYASSEKVVEKYLTVWQKQPDGAWKIFRNLVIP